MVNLEFKGRRGVVGFDSGLITVPLHSYVMWLSYNNIYKNIIIIFWDENINIYPRYFCDSYIKNN